MHMRTDSKLNFSFCLTCALYLLCLFHHDHAQNHLSSILYMSPMKTLLLFEVSETTAIRFDLKLHIFKPKLKRTPQSCLSVHVLGTYGPKHKECKVNYC